MKIKKTLLKMYEKGKVKSKTVDDPKILQKNCEKSVTVCENVLFLDVFETISIQKSEKKCNTLGKWNTLVCHILGVTFCGVTFWGFTFWGVTFWGVTFWSVTFWGVTLWGHAL